MAWGSFLDGHHMAVIQLSQWLPWALFGTQKKWKVKSVAFLMSTQRIARLGGATQRGGQAERRMVASGREWGGAVDRIDVRRKCS